MSRAIIHLSHDTRSECIKCIGNSYKIRHLQARVLAWQLCTNALHAPAQQLLGYTADELTPATPMRLMHLTDCRCRYCCRCCRCFCYCRSGCHFAATLLSIPSCISCSSFPSFPSYASSSPCPWISSLLAPQPAKPGPILSLHAVARCNSMQRRTICFFALVYSFSHYPARASRSCRPTLASGAWLRRCHLSQL